MSEANGAAEPLAQLTLSQRIALASCQKDINQAQANIALILKESGLDPNTDYQITPEGVVTEAATR